MNERQFRQLIDKYIAGTCTPEEEGLLHRFYDAIQRDAEEDESAAFDHWLQTEKIHRNIKRHIDDDDRQHYQDQRRRRARRRSRFAIAAAWLLLIGLGLGGYLAYTRLPAPPIAWQEKATQRGQKATITLTDGTKVYLNVDSKLTFPDRFGPDQREVRLEGEAFFEVARNPKRPFVITSRNLTTTVLGTSFNVKAFAHEPLEVTVATGRVKVNTLDTTGTTQEVLLQPHQQAYYDGTLHKKEVDLERYIAWRQKIIQFDEIPLSEAVVVLERWFNTSIDIESEQARSCRISGTYINENLINILNSLEHILNVKYQIKDSRRIVIEGEGCP